MSPELYTVIRFCLDRAESASVSERVSLYRGLAEICGDPKEAAKFRSMAADLETADHRCREFAFQFELGSAPKSPGSHPSSGNH
jgi:hypothetical protein